MHSAFTLQEAIATRDDLGILKALNQNLLRYLEVMVE